MGTAAEKNKKTLVGESRRLAEKYSSRVAGRFLQVAVRGKIRSMMGQEPLPPQTPVEKIVALAGKLPSLKKK